MRVHEREGPHDNGPIAAPRRRLRALRRDASGGVASSRRVATARASCAILRIRAPCIFWIAHRVAHGAEGHGAACSGAARNGRGKGVVVACHLDAFGTLRVDPTAWASLLPHRPGTTPIPCQPAEPSQALIPGVVVARLAGPCGAASRDADGRAPCTAADASRPCVVPAVRRRRWSEAERRGAQIGPTASATARQLGQHAQRAQHGAKALTTSNAAPTAASAATALAATTAVAATVTPPTTPASSKDGR